MFYAYLRTFSRLELKALPLRASSGPIGGDNSHEFIILADTGESQVYLDKSLLLKYKSLLLYNAKDFSCKILYYVRLE